MAKVSRKVWLGALRWHAPQPPSSWEGVREADTFAPDVIAKQPTREFFEAYLAE